MANYPIKIDKVKIENFRKFEHLEIDFSDNPLSVLSGRNATGKTSILEAINIAFSERTSKFTEVKESDFNSDEPIVINVWLNNPFFLELHDRLHNYSGLLPCWHFTKTIKRRTTKERNKFFSSEYDVSVDWGIKDYTPTTKEYNELKSLISEYKPSGSHIFREFLLDKDMNTIQYRIQSAPEGNFRTLEDLAPSMLKYDIESKLLFPKSFYFDKNRDRELLSQYNTAFSDVVTELNWRFKRRLLKDSNRDKKEGLFEHYQAIHEAIQDLDNSEEEFIFPAIERLREDFGLENDLESESGLGMFLFNLYQPYSQAFFGKISSKNQGILATDSGSGITMLLALSLSLSFAEKTKNPIITLVDEPEMHLHADLQKNLFTFLKNSPFHTIISTHSHLFIDKEDSKSNLILESSEDNLNITINPASKIDVSDLQFRLLGNSLDDLYIPERVLLVEGKHDRKLIKKCLALVDGEDLEIQIIDTGGKDRIPDKSEKYKEVLEEIFSTDKWYSEALRGGTQIIIDGDVVKTKIDGLASKYNLDQDKQIYHINPENDFCLEHLFPERLVKECVEETILDDDSALKEKEHLEIINIILSDDKESNKDNCKQIENRISKSRLNDFVENNITKDILESEEGGGLMSMIKWIIEYKK